VTDAFEIIGQDRALATLDRAVASGRVAHAYLFHGPRGVGKHAVALRFASRLLCEHPDGADPCGRCPSCVAFRAGEHPDFDRIAPPPGARNLSIDAVRELTRRASLSSSRGVRRVFVIDDAHALTEEAANSLLKILEEPPPGTVIVLVTHRPESLLPTVVSRTRAIPFHPLRREACLDVLDKRHGVPREEAEPLASLALFSPGRALELRESVSYKRKEEILERLCDVKRETVFEAASDLLEIARETGGGKTLENLREGLRQVFLLAGAFLRDVEARRRAGDGAEMIFRAPAGALRRALARGGGRWAAPGLDALGRARDALDGNVTPSLVTEWWLSDLVRKMDER